MRQDSVNIQEQEINPVKRIFLIILTVFILSGSVFASDSGIIYVRATGDDNNSGLSETEPKKTLRSALLLSVRARINRIMVLGTLDYNSEGMGRDSIFRAGDIPGLNRDTEILITGKPGASNNERAVLSAKGSGRAVMTVINASVRLENIEISGGETSSRSTSGIGIYVLEGASITLGAGAVVCDNAYWGMLVTENIKCVIDGGEVRNNQASGITISYDGVVLLRNGVITENSASSTGGGVWVLDGGSLTMTGGTITANNAVLGGGGVSVSRRGTFNQTGGTISRNNAPRFPDIWRQ